MREAYPNELMHYGILGMRWGVRRFQTATGKLTRAGIDRYRKRKDEEYKHEVKAHRLSEQEQRLSIARERADARQLATERRLENQRKRLENKRLKLENHDYEEAIKSGKSTKSYRDERTERLKTQNTKSQNNNQGNQNNNQNNNNQSDTTTNISVKDLANYDVHNFNDKELKALVDRLSNEKKLDDFYKENQPKPAKTKVIEWVKEFSKDVGVVAGAVGATVLLFKKFGEGKDVLKGMKKS